MIQGDTGGIIGYEGYREIQWDTKGYSGMQVIQGDTGDTGNTMHYKETQGDTGHTGGCRGYRGILGIHGDTGDTGNTWEYRGNSANTGWGCRGIQGDNTRRYRCDYFLARIQQIHLKINFTFVRICLLATIERMKGYWQ